MQSHIHNQEPPPHRRENRQLSPSPSVAWTRKGGCSLPDRTFPSSRRLLPPIPTTPEGRSLGTSTVYSSVLDVVGMGSCRRLDIHCEIRPRIPVQQLDESITSPIPLKISMLVWSDLQGCHNAGAEVINNNCISGLDYRQYTNMKVYNMYLYEHQRPTKVHYERYGEPKLRNECSK